MSIHFPALIICSYIVWKLSWQGYELMLVDKQVPHLYGEVDKMKVGTDKPAVSVAATIMYSYLQVRMIFEM